MQFFIHNLEGSTSTVSADASETVLRVKEKIEVLIPSVPPYPHPPFPQPPTILIVSPYIPFSQARGILPVQHQLLIHAGKLLNDSSLISECGLSHGESLTLTSRLLGGKPTKVPSFVTF
jgi:hypothetical protein